MNGRRPPTVSVVTVAFNSAGTIADTIRSVRAQQYDALEYVVVDGASTDLTLEIVHSETVNFPHQVQILSEPDAGIYDAMRKGIDRASGDVVAILNADDVLAGQDVVGRIAAAFTDETDAVLCDVEMVKSLNARGVVRFYSAKDFRPSALLSGDMPPHAGFYARRMLFVEHGSYRSDYRMAGDFELLVRFFLKHALRYTYLPITAVRMRTGGLSNRSLRHRVRLNREVLRALRENGYSVSSLALLRKIPGKLMQYFTRPGGPQ